MNRTIMQSKFFDEKGFEKLFHDKIRTGYVRRPLANKGTTMNGVVL